jgi:hypothetical protein
MADKIVSVPAAARTFHALRDLGYDLNSAIADVIDNSISRGKARNIFIYLNKDKKHKFNVRICDDGIGMTAETLEEAMRLGGAIDNYKRGDLSKYGMGMKTASLSQASKLTVLSKMKGCQKTCFKWDMHHVNSANSWEMFKLRKDEIKKIEDILSSDSDGFTRSNFRKLFLGKSWTVVLWEDLKDFQANYDSYSGASATNFYYKEIDRIELYLRMVFGRFISGENSARKINLFLNNKRLKAFDPFCRSEKHTLEIPLAKKNGNFTIDDLEPIKIKRYVLPTNPTKPGQFRFSSEEAWDESKGNLSWNEAQGYYVYRNNRLINWGGWYRTKTIDEHDKLARASIDLLDEHDNLFKLDVKKTRIQFPEVLKNHLQDNVNKGFISEAKKRYAGSEKGKTIESVLVKGKSIKVNLLASSLAKRDKISVVQKGDSQLVISNKYGKKISLDMTFKGLEVNRKLIPKSLGKNEVFWKMVPSPDSKFHVLINEDHPFYKKVYENAEKNPKVLAVIDAFLFTLSFVELKCITTNNEFLFEQMREVASVVLKKFVDEKIL